MENNNNSGDKASSATSDSESESNSMIKTSSASNKAKGGGGGNSALLIVPGSSSGGGNKKAAKKNQNQNNYMQHHHQHQEDLKKRPNEIEFTSQDSFLKKFSLLNHSQLNVGSVKNSEPSPMTERRLRKLSKSLYSPSTMKKIESSYSNSSNQAIQPLSPPQNDSNESGSVAANNHQQQHNLVENSSNDPSSKGRESTSLPSSSQAVKGIMMTSGQQKQYQQHQLKQLAEANSSTLSSCSSSTSSVKFRARWSARAFLDKCLFKVNYFVLSPDENVMYTWLMVLSACVLYNIWLIIARQSFEKLQTEYRDLWFVLDLVTEAVYALDILIQFRTGYLEQGLLVYNSKKLALNYIRSRHFLLDLFSLVPLEIAQFWLDYELPMLRFPRFFKVYRTIQFYYMTENRTLYPNVWRVANLTHILFCLGHWFAGFYFLISKAEGFKGHWSYPKPVDEFALLSRMYLRCLYWSTLTLTTIGDLPPPETNWQWLKEMSEARYLFSIAVHYLAVFVIALIVGQVGNVITNRNASRAEFERLLDGAKRYMRNHNVPAEMQKRVQRWYDYSWSRGRMNGAGDIHSIGLLPDKLKTELALHVNLETLRKVTIFQECQPEFLHDLVLKMRAYIFTPGDMICRKGEIAREMFIIADGVLEVIGDNGNVLTKMYSGDFFGEIGILNIEGASNRRTADVRSVGYAELFSLSKEDVLCAVKDYPEAERILIEYGKRRLLHNNNSRASVATSKASVLAVGEGVIISAGDTIRIQELVESESRREITTVTPIDKIVITGAEELPPPPPPLPPLPPLQPMSSITSSSRSRNTSVRSKPSHQYGPERKAINNNSNDIELGLKSVIVNSDETNRGLITDMLGLPASLNKPKQQPEIIISSAYTMTELNKIAQREENLESELNKTRAAEACLNKSITDTLDEIIKASESEKQAGVESLVKKLRDQLQQSKDKRIEFLEDLVAQKEAKIKLFDSRLRILQKYVSQKRADSSS